MASPSKLRIAVEGGGPDDARWASAIAASLGLLHVERDQQPAALVIGPAAAEPFLQASNALRDGVEVLLVTPNLAPEQLQALSALAQSLGRVLRFWEPFRAQQGFGFLTRLLGGEEPFWRPLYLRTLRLAPPAGDHPLEALAIEELAMLHSLLARSPVTVNATLGCAEGAHGAVAAFATLTYPDGLSVHSTISVAEASPRRELVVVTDGRSIVLDDGDDTAIESRARAEYAGQPAWRPPRRAHETLNPFASELASFAEQIAERPLGEDASVARRLLAASAWQAVRESMHSGRLVNVVAETHGAASAPELRLIKGKRKTASKVRKRPALELLPGRPLAG